jgi:Ca2+-binding EF-hand superfamily protein
VGGRAGRQAGQPEFKQCSNGQIDVDCTGQIDYTEFCEWVKMWDPVTGDGEEGQWFRGGSLDRRVWAASGAGSGKAGRLSRLMAMIDVDHNGKIECWEFLRALSRGDDYDRPIMGGGMGGGQAGGLGAGRLNPDGSLKEEFTEGYAERMAAAAL